MTNKIREKRIAMGLDYSSMAEMVGIEVNKYKAFEEGKEKVANEELLVICLTLGIDAGSVLDLSGSCKKETVEKKRNFDGEKLAGIRKKTVIENRKMSQAMLAERLNKNCMTVSKWERNVSSPGAETIRNLEEIFMVEKGYFGS